MTIKNAKGKALSTYYNIYSEDKSETSFQMGKGAYLITNYAYSINTNDFIPDDKIKEIEKAIADIMNPKGYTVTD